MYLKDDENTLNDVTNYQLFVGYKPLLILLKSFNLSSSDNLILHFGLDEKNIFGRIELEKINSINYSKINSSLFKGINGTHSFSSSSKQFLTGLKYKLTADRKKNLYLGDNLYRQVVIAYSIPRNIFLISIGKNNLFNIFPTDISGKIKPEYFLVSLRHNSFANRQVEEIKKIAVFRMSSVYFKDVYLLGKNHMNELRPETDFNIEDKKTENFKLLIPKGAIDYCEIELVSTNKIGIHNLHLFKIVNKHVLSSDKNVLQHIHRSYAEWRIKNNYKTECLIR